MECLERGRRIVREALWPTAREATEPCEGQGAPSRLVHLPLVAVLLVLDWGPEGMPDRCRGPCHARLSEERRTLPAPVSPGWLATACRDRCDACIFVEGFGGGAACSLCTEGHAEARGKAGPGPWQGVTQGEGGMGVGTRCHGRVDVGNGVQSHAELGDQGLDQEGMRGAHACICGPCPSVLKSRTTGRDDVGRAPVVGTDKALQGGAPGALGGFQGRPAAEEVAKDCRLFVLQPLEDVGEGVFERTRHAMRQPDCVAAKALAVCHALRQGCSPKTQVQGGVADSSGFCPAAAP